uniref:Thioredoxin-like protein n=1 Tax=Pyrodinium bahamense TaxID=73915 RepID=A0A7R9ZYB7_9DINO|mmetsp:Transcript_14785/g.40843  ORF Transcript_14785/g.40843 Transcript_14785/m.40843 type:complete len:143 (+) Transcript_14785:40-468(+)
MAHGLSHLHSAWAVEQAVSSDESRVVLLRFGHDYDPECMLMDELLLNAKDAVHATCSIHLVDIKEVPDFSQQYELYDPCTLMFFFRGRHLQLELGLGDRYKITWPLGGTKELADVVEAVHRGAQQGRDLIVATRDYSLAYRY